MGTIKKGILGGFSGKVGNVVGASWKGIAYMRSLPQKVSNPRTELQRMQRGKMATVVKFIRPMLVALRIGWKLYANKQSAFNAATRYTLDNALVGTYPDYSIDHTKVLVSRGPLPPAIEPSAYSEAMQANYNWDVCEGLGAANDKVMLVVLNPTKEEAVVSSLENVREDCHASVKLPTYWADDEVLCYMSLISEDGSEVSNSSFAGIINVA